MVYVSMTFLISTLMGVSCAIPILSIRFTNPLMGALGAFIGGFLFTFPFVAGIMACLYVFLNSFMLQFIFAVWLIAFNVINYMELNYIIPTKSVVRNVCTAFAIAITVYLFYKVVTGT